MRAGHFVVGRTHYGRPAEIDLTKSKWGMSEYNMVMENDERGPSVKFPPPLVFLIIMIFAYGAQHLWPLGAGTSSGIKYAGVAVIVLGICIAALAKRDFNRAMTHVAPWKPTRSIVSTGIYAYSRNPMYVAFCFAPVGVGIYMNSCWILVSFFPSVVIVYFIAIKKEEAYLKQKFGEAYEQYTTKVRRWL